VWQLRKGHRSNPSVGILESLSEFFGVQLSYFTEPGLTESEVQYQALLAAGLRNNDLLRQIVLLLVHTDEGTHRLVLGLLHHITALQQQTPTAPPPPT
jgi:transcriptional regulator with XRE-family HTH domain